MAEKKLTNPVNIIILVGIVMFFAFMISEWGITLSNSEHTALSTNSQSYIQDLSGDSTRVGFNVSLLDEDIGGALDDDTAENKYDFALDFVFGKKKANALSRFAYMLLSVPEFIIVDLFRFAKNDFKWVVDIMDWIWRIFLFVAIIYFIRGRI